MLANRLRPLIAVVVAAGGLGVGATASAAQTPPPTPAPTDTTVATAPPVPVTKKVAVKDNYFKPKKVSVAVGDKVIWTWKGYAIHDVTVIKGPQKFESEKQSSGTFTRTIKRPGTYKIVCTIHPGMEMTLKAT
jgi:plastocyanin